MMLKGNLDFLKNKTPYHSPVRTGPLNNSYFNLYQGTNKCAFNFPCVAATKINLAAVFFLCHVIFFPVSYSFCFLHSHFATFQILFPLFLSVYWTTSMATSEVPVYRH